MSQSKHKFAVIFSIACCLIANMSACRKTSAPEQKAEDSISLYADEYHADNDIAMTVRSITDALRVGEPLDTLDYNFEGILTDGEGHPLYTDIQGTPGSWDVDVISPTTAVIRNVYLGDLLPDDLESYLASSLNLSPENIIETEEFDDDEETQLVVYDIDGVYLRIETRAAVAPNGLEGPLMSIIATKTPPL
ncbi:MAG: hypothetical protein OSJ32_02825 [Muribaculaceae bacterium]|jgi:hypothetical protein|uniref:hypothetical protein n=2 Tax=Bacteroidales TaxID=171549 RepID=UPI000F51AA25|nr:hypothetical protein [Sangeribacter muris]MBJ2197598.1 hypothetical protein [Muribaculaceae bacterium]MCI9029650.1 hypothetical protein [Muribaculaceae bacterium]MCX4280234.1 hypothetical protein [Muribaculaceae bacterium]RXE68598.1 hypothetical protein ED328_06125 [Muribaculaceae bacterium Isolate-001 (NCI)]